MGNVLIVDDESAISAYLAKLISGLGHHVATASSASEMLAKLERGDCHLIIADILLPDAPVPTAWIQELCRRAKGKPVVLMTGAPSPELVACATKCGVHAFLSKPFELAFIKDILKTVFGG